MNPNSLGSIRSSRIALFPSSGHRRQNYLLNHRQSYMLLLDLSSASLNPELALGTLMAQIAGGFSQSNPQPPRYL
ncbi:hypothetical protein L1887_12585 [Cichorium endivia]|nr:hypothetical protein L1887_12585 [Cichorium endivia]